MAVRIKNLRWWIAALIAIATALNYLDRQSFPVVVGEIRRDIPFTTAQYGRLTSLFLFSYAVMYAVGGWLLDRLGTRTGYAIMIGVWSAANFLTGTVSSLMGLGGCRLLLGVGEGGGFPGSSKAVAEWFPPGERAMAFGIFNTGSAVGAVIAPPLIALVVASLGWRWVFFATGFAGFCFVVLWLAVYQVPARSRFISAQERALILSANAYAPDPAVPNPFPWIGFFRFRQVRGLLLAKFLSDSAWFFFIFWLPKYLGDVRHLNIAQIGTFAWIPFACAGMGSFAGGWLNGFLIRHGVSLDRSRKVTMSLGAMLVPVSLLIVSAPLGLAIVFFSLAMFAHQFWASIVMTLPADLFPSATVGSVGGLLGSAGAFGAMLFGLLVGWLVERDGYGPAFAIAGVLHPLALIVILCSIGHIGPLRIAHNPQDLLDTVAS
ncbi:MAG TPA: MFS transporter [Opitutaceae bacterium]|jgi:ACS family hexuronate transporter-like MFS transporter